MMGMTRWCRAWSRSPYLAAPPRRLRRLRRLPPWHSDARCPGSGAGGSDPIECSPFGAGYGAADLALADHADDIVTTAQDSPADPSERLLESESSPLLKYS